MPEIHFRHSRIRDHQKQMVHDVYAALEAGNHLLAHAPCGIGKTDAALSPAITYAMEHGLDVFFLTPKISQHKIAAEVVKGVAEKYGLSLRAVDMIGRRHACAHPALADLDQDTFYQTCERLRREEKCGFYSNARGNTKLEEAKAELLFRKMLNNYGAIKAHTEVIAESEEAHACPYELMIKLASNSKLIIADYFHMIAPQIRTLFLAKTKKKMENSIVIIDEAHNLPKRVRDYLSVSFNNRMISRMESEMKSMGGDMKFEKEFSGWARGALKQESEMLVPTEHLNSPLAYFAMKPEETADYFESAGVGYIEKTNRKSALLKFSKFLRGWYENTPGSIRILKGKGNFFSVSKRFLDPAVITSELNKAHSVIMMSATLHPMHMYRDVLGLDEKRTLMKSYPSPFPKSNKLNLIVEGTTTRYSQRNVEEFRKIAEMADRIHKFKKRTAVFFPSYNVLNSVLPFMKSTPKFVQGERMSPRDVHKLAKDFSTQGGMLIGVQGGSLSEGLDFGNGEIKTAIIVGIALEEMGLEVKSLIEYYQEKFGKGWEYAYIYPAVTRALQAAGRAIRKEEDRAAIVYLDERFNWQNYRKLFPAEERYAAVAAQDVDGYLAEFWKEDGNQL